MQPVQVEWLLITQAWVHFLGMDKLPPRKDGGKVKGVELGYQTFFDFLQSSWNGARGL